MKYDIISVGSAVVDAFVESKFKEKKGEMLIPIGRKILVEHLGFATGGGGTNTSAAFARFGLTRDCLGRLGRDDNGKMILGELKEIGVDFLGKSCDEPTGYSVILDSRMKDRTILTYRGANELLTSGDIEWDELDSAWFYFSTMLEKSLDSPIKLANWARKKGIKLAYNADGFVIENERAKVLEILQKTDVLIVNDDEANRLCRGEWSFKKLFRFGPRIACVTKGEEGSEACDGFFVFSSKPNKVEVVERTGAGDAFASGFVAGLIELDNVEQAVKIGQLNAESVIQKKGAKNGLLEWKDALRRIGSVKVRKSGFR